MSPIIPPLLLPLLQEVAHGRTLADMVASGWRADEGEVARIAAELLRTLSYLGSRRPPVTHRWGRRVGVGGRWSIECPSQHHSTRRQAPAGQYFLTMAPALLPCCG